MRACARDRSGPPRHPRRRGPRRPRRLRGLARAVRPVRRGGRVGLDGGLALPARSSGRGAAADRGENLIIDRPNRLAQTMRALWGPDAEQAGTSRVTWQIEPVEAACEIVHKASPRKRPASSAHLTRRGPRPVQSAGGRSSTCFLVRLSRIPFSTPVTALARTVTSLSALSRGRIILGIGADAIWDMIVKLGIPRLDGGSAVCAMAEAITLVRALSGGGDPVTFDGEFYHVDGLDPAAAPAPKVFTGSVGPGTIACPGPASPDSTERAWSTRSPERRWAWPGQRRSPLRSDTLSDIRTKCHRCSLRWRSDCTARRSLRPA